MGDTQVNLEQAKKWISEQVSNAPDNLKAAWQTISENIDSYYQSAKPLVVRDGKLDLTGLKNWAAEKGGDIQSAADAIGKELQKNGKAFYEAVEPAASSAAQGAKDFLGQVGDFFKNNQVGASAGILMAIVAFATGMIENPLMLLLAAVGAALVAGFMGDQNGVGRQAMSWATDKSKSQDGQSTGKEREQSAPQSTGQELVAGPNTVLVDEQAYIIQVAKDKSSAQVTRIVQVMKDQSGNEVLGPSADTDVKIELKGNETHAAMAERLTKLTELNDARKHVEDEAKDIQMVTAKVDNNGMITVDLEPKATDGKTFKAVLKGAVQENGIAWNSAQFLNPQGKPKDGLLVPGFQPLDVIQQGDGKVILVVPKQEFDAYMQALPASRAAALTQNGENRTTKVSSNEQSTAVFPQHVVDAVATMGNMPTDKGNKQSIPMLKISQPTVNI